MNKISGMEQNLNRVLQEVTSFDSRQNDRHNDMKNGMPRADDLSRRIQSIESTVQRIQRDIEGRDYKESLTGLQDALRNTQADLLKSLPQSMSQSKSSSP